MTTGRKLLAIQMPPGARFVAAWRAAWSQGDALLPLRPELGRAARDRLLAALRPHEFVDADGRRPLEDPAALDPRTDLVVATSGTTGEPKGVELSREALDASARATWKQLGRDRSDHWLCVLPLDHLAGLQVLHRAWMAGVPVSILPRFSVEAVAERRAATLVSLVPTQLARLLDAGLPLDGFRAILLGGAPPPATLLARARAAGARVVVTYGMTETAGGCVYDGMPLDRVDVRIDPDGRIALHGPMLFHGYRGDPDATARVLRDGWFRTSDLGRMVGGRLVVVGRADDVIVTGGEKVSAAAIAELLRTHPAVADAAVLGTADPEWGQRVRALVVPADAAAPPAGAGLRDWLRERVAAYAVPREFTIVDALPRTPLGKLDRRAAERLLPS